MRTLTTLLFTALLAVAGVAQAGTIEITVTGPLSSAQAQAGAHALRTLPAATAVFASAPYHAYAVEVGASGQIADSELTASLAQVGQSVSHIKHSTSSFSTVKARLLRSKHRYFKWG